MTKVLTIGLLVLTAATRASADERPVLNLSFPHHTFAFAPADVNAPPAVEQKTSGGGCDLIVSRRPDTPYVVTLWEMDAPPLATADCAVVGRVAYTDLRGPPATLELTATYADGTCVRGYTGNWDTLGPEQPFSGTSGGRPFRVALGGGAGPVPTHLALRAVLPGTGELNLISATLFEIPTPVTATNAAGQHAATPPASAPGTDDNPVASALADLGPAQSAQQRATISQWLAATVHNQALAEADLRDAEARFGAASVPVMDRRHALKVIDADIAAMRQSLAPAPAGAPLLVPLDGLFYLILGHVGVVVGAYWVWFWVRQGRCRRTAWLFCGLVLLHAVGELFAAGVCVGMRKPPEIDAIFLGGAVVLFAVAATVLPQVNRQFSILELRKMRAMDVA